MNTVLVTGGGGFIGSHVCERLRERGDRVVVLDRPLDIRSPELGFAMHRHRPDVVVHLAAQTSVADSMLNPIHDLGTNLVATVALLGYCAEAGSRFVYAASGGTLYGNARIFPTPESEAGRTPPLSCYGASKKAVLDYLACFPVASVALALGNVYGPGQRSGIIRAALGSKPPTISGDGEQTRDFVHVADVADAFVSATERGGGLINIGTGVETSVLGVLDLVGEALGRRSAPVHGPQHPGEVRRSCLDPTRAWEELGWRPTIGLREGIAALLH